MATWIKMRHELLDAPEIRRIGRATGLDRDQVYGKLYRLWTWFDRHSTGGIMAAADFDDVDEQVGLCGFGASLESVGWLVKTDVGIEIPHWDRHNSESAKERALKKNRMERVRGATSATEVDNPVAQQAPLEESRGEERREDIPLHPPAASREEWEKLKAAWQPAVAAGHAAPWQSRKPPEGFPQRISDPDWIDEALRAIQRLPRCKQFTTPVTLSQLCKLGFVEKILGGVFDDAKRVRGSPAGGAVEPKPDPAKRRFFRTEFQRNMTDYEFELAMKARQPVAGGAS